MTCESPVVWNYQVGNMIVGFCFIISHCFRAKHVFPFSVFQGLSLCKRGQIWLWARVRRWRRIVWWQTSLQNAVRKLVATWNQIWRVVLIVFAHLLDTMSLLLKGAWYYISLCYYERNWSTQSVLMPGLGFWIFDNMLWFWFRKLQKNN